MDFIFGRTLSNGSVIFYEISLGPEKKIKKARDFKCWDFMGYFRVQDFLLEKIGGKTDECDSHEDVIAVVWWRFVLACSRAFGLVALLVQCHTFGLLLEL